MSGIERIQKEIRLCDQLFSKNMENYRRSNNRRYLRQARSYYICAREMETILRLYAKNGNPENETDRLSTAEERK